MPFGLQVVGRFREDHRTLGVAAAMGQAFAKSDVLRRSPPALDKLRAAEPALTSIVTAPPMLDTRPGAASAPTSAV